MKKIDQLDIGTKQLQLLIAVLESGSVTAAAQQLDLTQSAVSHGLDRLRAFTGDALFVKAGRGIAPTARAEVLGRQAKALLRELYALGNDGERFDPARWQTTLTIAANDFQRDLLLPGLVKRLRAHAPGVTVRMLHSGVPTAAMLREDRVQLVISPRPPDGSDIMQKRLLTDSYSVYFDASLRQAPASKAAFLKAQHATVIYEGGRKLDVDAHWLAQGVVRDVAVAVPGFSALPAFVRGSDLLTVAPSLLARSSFSGLGVAPMPLAAPRLAMYAIWHLRDHQDPAHRWLRGQLDEVVKEVVHPQKGQ